MRCLAQDQCGALHGAIAAEQLLQPMDQGDFQSHFWGRKPFLLARHKCKTNYDKTGVASSSCLCFILKKKKKTIRAARLGRLGKIVPEHNQWNGR
eukprot:SAG31_NODE_313_length_17858_cov_34.811307_4_plen_95_part_00